MKKVNFILSLLSILISVPAFSQVEEDSIPLYLEIREMSTDRDFGRKYKRELDKVRKVYPMALKAKALIVQYEKDLAEIAKDKKQKKYSKEAQKDLKEQFTYSIRNLYVSEGNLLMELVHRETGMTVNQIIRKYRGDFQATVYEGMGNLFDQNLDATYDAEGKNQLTEIVIQDILNGDIEFNPEMDVLTKEEFRKTQQEYRAAKKQTKSNHRTFIREKKLKERAQRKTLKAQKKAQ